MCRVWSAAALIAAAVALVGCGSDSASLILPPGGTRTVAQEREYRAPGQSQAESLELVCLNRPGSVHVEAVRPVGSTGGLHVQAFVVQKSPWMSGPNRSAIGDAYSTLKRAGVLKDHVKRLTMVCNVKTGAGYIVDIQMAYTHGQVGHADGLEVDYVSGGVHKKTFLPIAFTLCAGGDHDQACARIAPTLHPLSQLTAEAAEPH